MREKLNTSTILVMIISMISTFDMLGQIPEWRKTQYQAYLSQNISMWHQSYKLAEANDDAFTRGLAGYAILNASLPLQNEDLFDEYLDDTSNPLEKIIDEEGSQAAEAKAIMSGILGLRIAYAPYKGMFLGGKSGNFADDAIKEAPDSYIAWKLYGNYKFYTPGAFGGDINEAAKALEKSIDLMEQDPELTQDNWMYIDAMAHLGQAYVQLDQPVKAKHIYEKVLKIEPNYVWVSKVLLPQLDAQ